MRDLMAFLVGGAAGVMAASVYGSKAKAEAKALANYARTLELDLRTKVSADADRVIRAARNGVKQTSGDIEAILSKL